MTQIAIISDLGLSDPFESLIRPSPSRDGAKEEDKQVPKDNMMAERLHILDITTEFKAPIDWLADVENRIQNSIGQDTAPSSEWLTPDAGKAALHFLQYAGDLLPCEPHIYGTREGNLVAEFETQRLRMTVIVTPDGTTLFGYRRDKDEAPHQVWIRRGSNSSREEVRSFTRALGDIPHGKAVEAGS